MHKISDFTHWLVIVFLALTAVLTACSRTTPVANVPATEPARAVTESTPLPALTLTVTNPLTPTHKPTTAPTATFTPQPTSTQTQTPTITPTFDAYHLVTATQVRAETCPKKNPLLRAPDFHHLLEERVMKNSHDIHFQQDYLDYFNAGGIVDNILDPNWRPDYMMDLTNDGVPEYIIQWEDVFILGCKSGQFQILLDARAYDGVNRIEAIGDANLNGMPEFVLREKITETTRIFNLMEWDGTKFRSLLVPNEHNVTSDGLYQTQKLEEVASFRFTNVDSDPPLELVVTIYPSQDDLDLYFAGFPWRTQYDYYKWNGSGFSYSKQSYDSPTFRFQSVNDGDWAFKFGEYQKAVSFYQKAINDKDLLWYTEEHRQYFMVKENYWHFYAKLHGVMPAPGKYDPDEYPSLAAYAYFRMMLADIKLGQMKFAQSSYDWLQTNFPAGKPGHVYAELAARFWNTYQTSQDFSQSCAEAQAYAKLNPEAVFRYLSSSVTIDGNEINWPNPTNFGQQSSELKYSPELICPR